MMMYITTLKPDSKVTAHAHNYGVELYHILEGYGEIYTGVITDGQRVKWNDPKSVKSGDVFSIAPNVIHQLKNVSETEDLVLLFVCPRTHLAEDRIIAEDFSL
jgi:quercetin dioxygenase-like cupin family protein